MNSSEQIIFISSLSKALDIEKIDQIFQKAIDFVQTTAKGVEVFCDSFAKLYELIGEKLNLFEGFLKANPQLESFFVDFIKPLLSKEGFLCVVVGLSLVKVGAEIINLARDFRKSKDLDSFLDTYSNKMLGMTIGAFIGGVACYCFFPGPSLIATGCGIVVGACIGSFVPKNSDLNTLDSSKIKVEVKELVFTTKNSFSQIKKITEMENSHKACFITNQTRKQGHPPIDPNLANALNLTQEQKASYMKFFFDPIRQTE